MKSDLDYKRPMRYRRDLGLIPNPKRSRISTAVPFDEALLPEISPSLHLAKLARQVVSR